jgi:hypothetical protein
MKLKKKHYEIAKTIAHFVDRNYYPDFTEPTREKDRGTHDQWQTTIRSTNQDDP